MTSPALTGKVALITGGARRVGATVGRLLHAHGMQLAVHYRSSDADARAFAAELNAQRPDSVMLVRADLLDIARLPEMVAEIMRSCGRLDVLINNASSFYPTPVGTATERQWEDLMGSNLKAPFFLSQAAAPALKAQHGCIINMVDIHGERPLKQYPIYSAAKAGLIMLTKSLARELGPEVRVNGIAPGTILWPEHGLDDTTKQQILARTPQKRAGSPDDIARTMLFLIRDADYITGQIIAVDGGRSVVL
jgi:pteridine reductase